MKLTKLTAEEIAYARQRKLLTYVPSEIDHVLNGLLYYRIQNDLHMLDSDSFKTLEQRTEQDESRKRKRDVTRFKTTFTGRLAQHKENLIKHSDGGKGMLNEKKLMLLVSV